MKRYLNWIILFLFVLSLLVFALSPAGFTGNVYRSLFGFRLEHSSKTFFDLHYNQIQWAAHSLIMFIITIVFFGIVNKRKKTTAFFSIIASLMAVTLLGVFMELSQSLLPAAYNRHPDWNDIIANESGILLACLFLTLKYFKYSKQ